MNKNTVTFNFSLVGFICLLAVCLLAAISILTENQSHDFFEDIDYRVADILEVIQEEDFTQPQIDFKDPVLNQRKIFIASDLDDKTAEEVMLKLSYLDGLSSTTPIHLYIQTSGGRGGDVLAAFIQTISSPVNTYALDWCQSAGVIVLASGTGRRYAMSNARINLHIIGEDYDAAYSDPQYVYGKQYYYTGRQFWQSVSNLPESIYAASEDIFFYFNAEQALKYGIIDEILPYKKKVETEGGL